MEWSLTVPLFHPLVEEKRGGKENKVGEDFPPAH
jgi:hypothetical protein